MVLLMLCLVLLGGACSSAASDPAAEPANAASTPIAPAPSPSDTAPAPDIVEVEPQPFVPSGQVGDADAYSAMIDELAQHVPPNLRSEVPWPDLRNPDPVVAQKQIFELWIWMLENHPEPRLIDALAAPGSPDRETVAGVFGDLSVDNQLIVRRGAPYKAYDHQAITWDSAGLPLWLTRDVPEPAVVLYYRDESGPSTVIDRDTQAVIGEEGGPGVRDWVAIIVETDVGWRLWRDVEIDPADSELEVPEIEKPGSRAEQDRRNV